MGIPDLALFHMCQCPGDAPLRYSSEEFAGRDLRNSMSRHISAPASGCCSLVGSAKCCGPVRNFRNACHLPHCRSAQSILMPSMVHHLHIAGAQRAREFSTKKTTRNTWRAMMSAWSDDGLMVLDPATRRGPDVCECEGVSCLPRRKLLAPLARLWIGQPPDQSSCFPAV
jgi:hypothetical protein